MEVRKEKHCCYGSLIRTASQNPGVLLRQVLCKQKKNMFPALANLKCKVGDRWIQINLRTYSEWYGTEQPSSFLKEMNRIDNHLMMS